jgi:hypothetical protein
MNNPHIPLFNLVSEKEITNIQSLSPGPGALLTILLQQYRAFVILKEDVVLDHVPLLLKE